MSAFGRKASEAYTAAARRVSDVISNVTTSNHNKDNNKSSSSSSGRNGRKNGGESGNNNNATSGNSNSRCVDSAAPYGFLENMCGPMLRNFNNDLAGGSDDADELAARNNRSSRSSSRRGGGDSDRGRGRSGGGGGGRRPMSSYDYDDETNATDITGSYEEDDETMDDESRKKSSSRGRGRDRKPRPPEDSPSEITGAYSEYDDDTTQNDTLTEASSAYYDNKKESSKRSSSHKSKRKQSDDSITKESEKLITQPLASGFAKRCYFTKAGIGRNTQHYEGLTLTGNTVLMLAAAMKLKGCPTICDEDLRRVESTYPNQFSRLPDELLLSSGWRRISKYCHFSLKPLPDGVPFFHSKQRCHPNGGFYFLLCSAVGMTRLMDVEALNRDALVVLQTDFPMTCEKAPSFLMEDPNEWTLVNKFCFFSGGPVNTEEDVYYRAELGGTEIYMLAFLSPSLSPKELYRLESSASGGGKDAEPLKSVTAVEEVESVYDLTERDFDDLKLYHLGPCRALPPFLLHPQAWTKVLPPHFIAARNEALSIAQEWESRCPPPASAGSQKAQGVPGGASTIAGASPRTTAYVELGQAGGRPPPDSRGSGGDVGPMYPMQYPGMHQQQHDPNNAPYYPPMGYPPQHQQYGAPPSPIDEMHYYYGGPPQFQQQHNMPPGGSTYGNPYSGGGLHVDTMSQQLPPGAGMHHPYANTQHPHNQMGDPHWMDVHEEGAFHSGMGGGDIPDDEAIATRRAMYDGMNSVGPGPMHGNMPMMAPQFNDQYENHSIDPPVDADVDVSINHHAHGDENVTSALMGGAQNRLKQKRMKKIDGLSKRPDLSTKLGIDTNIMPPGGTAADDSTWDTRTDAESSYGTSLVSGSSYTDATNPNERNSRRALILQMAKARMKNVKESSAAEKHNPESQQEEAPLQHKNATLELVDEVAGLELD